MTADREHRTITVERMRWWRNPDVLLPIIAAATVLSLAGLVAISLQVAAVLRAQSQAAQEAGELAAATSQCVLQFLRIPPDERYLVPEQELRDLCEVDPGPRPDTSVPPGGFPSSPPGATSEPTPTPTPTPTPEPTATVSLFGPPAVVTQPPRPPAPGPAPQPIAPQPAPQPPPEDPDRPGQRPPHAGQGRPDQPPGRDR